jgi:non-specific serine/threonine protein kinase
MLRAARVVTLVGPGGVGKTRLAQRLARQVERVFRDSVVMVELAALQDAAGVASAVARAVGVEPQGQPVEKALDNYLAAREVVVVLDNCEHLLRAVADLAERWLAVSPGLRILTTSRQALDVSGEHVMSLQPLTLPTPDEVTSGRISHVESVALLVDRARAIDPAFRVGPSNAHLVARLVNRLDGIPLAIELAAARLRVLSVGQLVERLDDRFAVLSTGARTLPPRQQTLRALIEWSYDLCSDEEQALWASMSVFEGGADHDSVEAVCAHPGGSVDAALMGLVDKSVVQSVEGDGGVRFHMLQTIREYGTERMVERSDQDLIRRRHQDHYLGLAARSREAWFGPDQVEWVARIGADLGNLRAALEHCLVRGDVEAALHLLGSLNWYWRPAGDLDEGARWFARALTGDHPPTPSLLRALSDAAQLAGHRNDVEMARPVAHRAVALPVTEATAADRAARHLARAHVATIEGRYSDALGAQQSALVDLRLAGDLMRQVEVLQDIAMITGFIGDPADAIAFLDEALALCDAHGDRFERRDVLMLYGYLYRILRRTQDSLDQLRASLTVWPVVGAAGVASIVELMSRTYASAGEHERATVLLGARIRLWHDHGHGPSPFLPEGFAPEEKSLRDQLGEQRFDTAYAEGYSMGLEDIVRCALGESGPQRSARASSVRRLSRRENQVATLLAQGLSNKEIAEELIVSVRTAEGHVAKVMD